MHDTSVMASVVWSWRMYLLVSFLTGPNYAFIFLAMLFMACLACFDLCLILESAPPVRLHIANAYDDAWS